MQHVDWSHLTFKPQKMTDGHSENLFIAGTETVKLSARELETINLAMGFIKLVANREGYDSWKGAVGMLNAIGIDLETVENLEAAVNNIGA